MTILLWAIIAITVVLNCMTIYYNVKTAKILKQNSIRLKEQTAWYDEQTRIAKERMERNSMPDANRIV